jgi:hypothetical protein
LGCLSTVIVSCYIVAFRSCTFFAVESNEVVTVALTS